MGKARALMRMQSMIQSFGQPVAKHVNLGGIPLLKEIQYPQFISYFASDLIHAVPGKVYVTLTHVFSRAGYVLQQRKHVFS